MPLPVRGIALSALAVLCLLAAPATAAQFVPPTVAPAAPRLSEAPGAPLALDGPVDPATYIVGPGDVFEISIGGSLTSGGLGTTTATVSADGLLVIPQAGSFEAAGRTLAAVQAAARAALRRQFRNVPTDVALATPRQFSVFVSGAVPAPGRQTLSAVGRVEDAVAAATDGVAPLNLADYATPPGAEGSRRRTALRNVRVVGLDGRTASVDLLRYYATGDLAYNPPMRDGATVFVPTFDVLREGVAVGGDVDRPGIYDPREGDTAAALVAVAGGPGLGLADATVRRTRVVGGERVVAEVPLAEAATLEILPRDQVSVRAGVPDAGFADAAGAVEYPGAYPIIAGETTVGELIDAAGGLLPDALVRGAYLERRPAVDEEGLPTDPDSLAATGLGALSDLGAAGRQYFAQETLAPPRISVDLAAALAGTASISLRDGDRLVVPRDLGLIRVSGQVGAPGLVPFVAGRTARDYVEAAGGQGPAATAIYTVDARTGRFTAGPDTPVRPGDAVFVDRPELAASVELQGQSIQRDQLDIQRGQLELQLRREEREAASENRRTLFQVIGTTLTAVSTAVTLYLLIDRPATD